ncbi:hypothetical protein AGR13a_Cc40003 [Agrobacterium genomosp. 13 str. CFBP 6927]|uniref:Uncharacterized protein n=1 Tax=Agrobacterium genomosp. 13 str. CFBP 6927 TaxID=1183428 RepID=A0ABM9VHQ9_9HYPH|nr:hypothetical protein AGR13a_Cc40003 [Agrobacterium genomosp. 13 str. CFBP 6927]
MAWQAGAFRQVLGAPPNLIPVPVTGIQPTHVCAGKDSSQPKDLGWLDPCDKHRDEEKP